MNCAAGILIVLLPALGSAAGARPEVQNGGMLGPPQDHSDGKGQLVTPPGWTPVNTDVARGDRIGVEPSDRPGAGPCLHIKTFGSDAGVYQTLPPLDKGTTYLVSAWVKRLSGELAVEAYPYAWGPCVMRHVDGSSQGWRQVVVGLTPIDGGAHLYLVATGKADFLIGDVHLRVAGIQVSDPTPQPYDLGATWRYRAVVSCQSLRERRPVLAQALPEGPLPSALCPAVKVTLDPAGPVPVEFRLPFGTGSSTFALQVTDAATGEILGGSALVAQQGSPWDVRTPYKDALFASAGYRWPLQVALKHTPAGIVQSLRAEAVITGGAGGERRRVASVPTDSGLQIPLAGQGLPPGDYRLALRVADRAGRVCYQVERPLRVLPPGAHEVVFASDGEARVDGRPFFPIGMYWVFARPEDWRPGPLRKDADLRELRACGVNTLHSYTFEHSEPNDTDANALAYLDTAAEFGFKVMMGLRRDWYQGDKLDLAAVERRVRALRDHPALLCWTLWDEPNFDPAFSAPRVRAMYALISRLDPYHPAMPVFGGPSAGGFRDCADAFLFDNYPGPGHADQVAQTVARARDAMPEKPVWFVAQAFHSPGEALPSAEDMRQYWRNALQGGARAVFWYSYGGGGKDWDSVRTDPAHWEHVQQIISELARKVGPAAYPDGGAP